MGQGSRSTVLRERGLGTACGATAGSAKAPAQVLLRPSPQWTEWLLPAGNEAKAPPYSGR